MGLYSWIWMSRLCSRASLMHSSSDINRVLRRCGGSNASGDRLVDAAWAGAGVWPVDCGWFVLVVCAFASSAAPQANKRQRIRFDAIRPEECLIRRDSSNNRMSQVRFCSNSEESDFPSWLRYEIHNSWASACCSFQTVVDGVPFTGFRQRFHNDPFRAKLIALVQLRVNRPRKCLGIVRDHAHAPEIFM